MLRHAGLVGARNPAHVMRPADIVHEAAEAVVSLDLVDLGRRVVGECSCGGCLVPTWLKLVRPAACNDHRRVFAPVHLGT